MYGDKQVGLILVGNLRTTVEFYETVCLTGIDHLDARTILLHHPTEGKGELQGQVLLLGDSAHSTRIMSAVAGIDHQRERLAGSGCCQR